MAVNVLWRIFSKKKAIPILLTLFKGAKGVQEIQEAIGGSYTTINKRIEELLGAKPIKEEYLTGEEFGEVPPNKRWIQISDDGRRLIQSLVTSNFLKIPLLNKDRQKWIILVLHLLKTVSGRTRLTKLLFLSKHELGVRRGNSFKFEAGKYGPFSREIMWDTEELQNDGLISVRETKPPKNEFSDDEKTRYIYRLRPQGEALVHELLADLPDEILQRLEKLRRFNKMPLLKLLRYIYERYPKFIVNSIIVNRVLEHWENAAHRN